jgi:flagellar hook-associated protein 1 FlgK
LLEVRDVIITDDKTRLDTLAGTLMTDVNVLHQAGFDLNGIGGEVFFIGTGTAADLEVNPNIVGDLNFIAAATDATTVPGDSRNAIEIASLQYELSMGGTQSYNDYYGAIVRDTGNEVLKSDAYYNHQSDMMVQLENQRESVSGVSLDEEMINLIKFQNAYTAAAKMITTADEMMQTVLQRRNDANGFADNLRREAWFGSGTDEIGVKRFCTFPNMADRIPTGRG